ncbi:hypothetical protein SMICM17S_05785 [Streptomyces microflavus]
MPKRASDSSGEASARKMLHETLKRLRDRLGLSLEELHDETTYDRSYLHKLETGARLGSLEVMAALDKVYGTGEQLQQLWELARHMPRPSSPGSDAGAVSEDPARHHGS